MQIQNVLRTHLDRLNDIPIFKSSMKIFIPENNLGNEGSHLWNMIKKRPDVRCYSTKNDRVGIHKGPETADEYQYMMNVKLKNDAIKFDSEFFTTSKKHTTKSIRATLRDQAERYHFAYEEPKTIHQNGKQTITGKGGPSEQDDLMIALLMGMFHGWAALKNPRKFH